MLAWVAFVVVCVGVGGLAGTRSQTDAQQAVGEWGRAEQWVLDGHFADPAMENVLITSRSGTLDAAAAGAAATEVRQRLGRLPQVGSVAEPVTAPGGKAVLVRAAMTGAADDAGDHVQPLLDATAAVQAAHPQLRVEEVGGGTIDKALDKTYGEDFQKAEVLSIPVTLVILVVAFGALLAAAVPVLLALTSVAAAMGLSALASHLLPLTDTTASVVLLIGMAVGVDYSLFYVRRAREERARGRTALDAVEIAAATSGRAVVVSGCTVMVAMAGMFLSGSVIFSSLALGAILVVAVSVLGSITVLPAVLAGLGRWVDRPRVPLLHRLTMRPGRPQRVWPALLRPTLRHPALALGVGAGALALLALPALGLQTSLTGVGDLPRSIPALQTYDRLTAAFPSEGASAVVVVKADPAAAGAVRSALLDLDGRTAADPHFAPASEPDLDVSADGRISRLSLGIRAEAETDDAKEALTLLRTRLLPATVGQVPGARTAVGGDTAASVDFSKSLSDRLPLVVGFVLGLTFLLVLWTFRSVVVAATAIGLNLLSVGAAYGLLVVVFQHSWAEGLLGFHSNGTIVAWLPMFLFVVLFGLSMDYHVFVVSRIRELAMRGMPTRDAVREGIVGSAGAVTSAAVVMVAVFSIFATLSGLEFKQMCVGLAAAVLLDATIVRAVLLPAAMTLLGRWNWWAPPLLRTRQPVPQDTPGELVGV
ncbi:MAG TPA: MMPL family transporter [Mycobacteriales bacterium]|nr:MMPL family transporter [Mycobacteriales bacterium]